MLRITSVHKSIALDRNRVIEERVGKNNRKLAKISINLVI